MEQKLARFPAVDDAYQGFYLRFKPATPEGQRALAGSEGIIGSQLKATLTGDDPNADVCLQTLLGVTLTIPRGEFAEKIRRALLVGWSVNIVLSLVVYSKPENGFWAEAACICYDPGLGVPLEQFSRNINYRVSKGDHPGLSLTQEQFVHVIESNGAWYLTKAIPLPELEKGEVIYKSRKAWSEYLVQAAVSGNLGCKLGAILFWLAVAVGAIWLIWSAIS
jgi:hypothetical protein